MDATDACLQMDADEARFDLIQGAIVVDSHAVGFWGARGIQHVFLGSGRTFDLTCGVGGADRLFLQGASSDHQVDVADDVLILSHAAQGTEIRVHASRGPRELVFDDGAVTLGALWRSVRQTSALLDVVGEAAAVARATVASHVNAGPRLALGAVPHGALLQLEGLGGVETVFVGQPGVQVHLDATLAEHKARVAGRALALSRRASGLLETAYVIGSAQLVFVDGSVHTDAMSHAVMFNEPWPVPQGESVPALPRITAVALDVDSADVDWSDDWPGALPSGLFGGCRAGQVFEASVSLEEAVKVEGTPRLHLCVGGRHRAAQFSGGSGTDTLHFVYTVTEDDVAQGTGSQTRGLTLTGCGNLDVEVGPVLSTGATIRALQPSLLEEDPPVSQPSATVLDDSGWQALIDESDRKVARALAMLNEGDTAHCAVRSSHFTRPDLELDLLLDIDLADLELTAEVSGGYQRQPAARVAAQAH
ncbi:hypothetical protein [Hydrogenophaga sp.]|uniref:hypothetical protein n=1 Tax=Hydrogenophaga sp. TaxID=1904254 RepID=UPI003F721434